MNIERIVITGSSGYYGSRLVRYIREVDPNVEILGLDVVPPRGVGPHQFVSLDIRDRQLRNVIQDFRPDTIVHLAFVVDPMHDEQRMHDININGSRNLLDAVHEIAPQRLLVASSGVALGAWPDNPVPLDDRSPIRARTECTYSSDKSELEAMVAEFRRRHREVRVSWTRPCVVYGPGVDNYFSRMQLNYPLVVLPDGCDVPQQLVHEDDLVAATWCILNRGGSGPYNVAPPNWIGLKELARETRRRTLSVPLWLMNLAAMFCWTFRLSAIPHPPAMNQFVRYPWVLAPNRLMQELGFTFQYSTLETLHALLKTRDQSAASIRYEAKDVRSESRDGQQQDRFAA